MSTVLVKRSMEELAKEIAVVRPNPGLNAMLCDELYAYITADKKFAGILMCDKVDNDFSFVVLQVNKDKTTETIDLKVSVETEAEADKLLQNKLLSLK